ncbi:MAG: ribosome recycling factor [Anaerolineales bacterium]|jgi:ribosome recycling factor
MISEDDQKRGEDELQKITDRLIDEINAICERKEKEILEV